jgi:signal transduction histidine kinase
VAHLDTANRRIDLQVVYLGPAGSGTSTSLRFLHAACEPSARGELATVEHGGGRGIVCDYAPFELPRWGDLAVRAHVYVLVAGDGRQGAHRRLLAGADAVVFVADARRGSLERDLQAWRHLDALLSSLEDADGSCPLLVAANHSDAADALPTEELLASFASTAPGRRVLEALTTCASAGTNVTACFGRALEAAAERALPPQPPEAGETKRRAFRAAFAERFKAPAVPGAAPAAARRVAVPSTQGVSDGTGLNQALDVSRWLALRELDVRRLQRERALGRLMLEVGQMCLAATEIESLLRRVLGVLTMNLDAVSGWIGLPDAQGHTVYDPMGVSTDGSGFAETAEALGLGLPDGGVVAVGAETGALLPGGATGGRGLFAPFPGGDGRRGWLLLVGPPDRGLPDDAEAVLATAGAFVGLTLARLSALKRLRESHAALEDRVGARTQELQQEKARLEERVRERTRELEQARRAAVESERRLLDRERAEGVHRLAAGLAHELNNPIGAALANVDFVLEGVKRLEPSIPVVARSDLGDVLEAAEDARRDLKRVAASVTALFGQAASTRRAAVKTPLAASVREALRAYGRAMPRLPAPALAVLDEVSCGIPPAECSRWLFRVLTTLAQVHAPAASLEVDRSPDGPRVRLHLSTDAEAAREALGALAQEVSRAGARLTAVGGGDGPALDLVLPPALGESSMVVAAVGAASEPRR